jgi:hypothetical protein
MADTGNQQPPINNRGVANNASTTTTTNSVSTNNSSAVSSSNKSVSNKSNSGNVSNTSGANATPVNTTQANTTQANTTPANTNNIGNNNSSGNNRGNNSNNNSGNISNNSSNISNNSNSNTGNNNTSNTGNNNRRNNRQNVVSNNKPANTGNTGTNTNANTKTLTQKASNTVKSATNNAKAKITETTGMSEDTLMLVLKVVLVVVVLLTLFYVGRYYFNRYTDMLYNSPYLLDGIKSAKRSLVVSQDPKNSSYIPIAKSENKDGIQFTYDFWLLVETYDYKPGEWKHVFHKGNASGYPNRAPGVWLHPSKNALRFYMNSQEDILEYVDVDNIPARKWIHISLVLDDKDMDVYVNGYLKARKKLSSVPKQNNGDFWCNMFGGFEGYMARIRYYSRAITPEEILGNVRAGPGDSKCLDGSDVPQYLDDNWWYSV